MSHDNEYEVGYGKPPKHSQFKKGQSGNLNGRPKKRKDGKDLFHALLDTEMLVDGKMMTKRELVALSIVNGAIKGNSHCRSLIMPMLHNDNAEMEDFDPTDDDEVEWMKVSHQMKSRKEEASE